MCICQCNHVNWWLLVLASQWYYMQIPSKVCRYNGKVSGITLDGKLDHDWCQVLVIFNLGLRQGYAQIYNKSSISFSAPANSEVLVVFILSVASFWLLGKETDIAWGLGYHISFLVSISGPSQFCSCGPIPAIHSIICPNKQPISIISERRWMPVPFDLAPYNIFH